MNRKPKNTIDLAVLSNSKSPVAAVVIEDPAKIFVGLLAVFECLSSPAQNHQAGADDHDHPQQGGAAG